MVPVAYDKDDNVVVAGHLLPKETGPFRCLECHAQVLLHKGDIRRPYFRHKPDTNSQAIKCTQMTLEHKAAIQLLVKYMTEFKFARKCCLCHHTSPYKSFATMSPKAEVSVLDGKYRLDVGLMDKDDKISCAIEVFQTHAIGTDKRLALAMAGITVYEVSATSVLKSFEESSFELTDLWKQWKCFFCQDVLDFCKILTFPCNRCHKAASVLLQNDNNKNLDILTGEVQLVQIDVAKQIAHLTPSQKNRYCPQCLQRPCLGCGKWQTSTTMTLIDAPPYTSKYPQAYVCNQCKILCKTCNVQPTVEKAGHCASCQREAGNLYRQYATQWKYNNWVYGQPPPSLAQLRTELFLMQQH